jgi:hypothetical protein
VSRQARFLIRSPHEASGEDAAGEQHAADEQHVVSAGVVRRANAEQSRAAIVESAEVKGPLNSGALKVVTGYYNLDSGVVTIG